MLTINEFFILKISNLVLVIKDVENSTNLDFP